MSFSTAHVFRVMTFGLFAGIARDHACMDAGSTVVRVIETLLPGQLKHSLT